MAATPVSPGMRGAFDHAIALGLGEVAAHRGVSGEARGLDGRQQGLNVGGFNTFNSDRSRRHVALSVAGCRIKPGMTIGMRRGELERSCD